MKMSLEELRFFSISMFLDFIDDYVEMKNISFNKANNQKTYEGADGLDKFLGG